MAPSRRFAVLVALALTVALAGCAGVLGPDGDDGPDADDYDAADLRANASAAMADADSYRVDVQQEVDVYDRENDSLLYSLSVDASGRTNVEQDATRLDLLTEFGIAIRSFTVEAEGLHLGERAYVLEPDAEAWDLQSERAPWTPAGEDVALLESATASVDGTATVDDREAIRLVLEPDDAVVATYGLDRNVSADPRPPDAEVESATVTAYVSPEAPHYVYRTELESRAVHGEDVFETTVTVDYRDFDEDVSVDVPAELAE